MRLCYGLGTFFDLPHNRFQTLKQKNKIRWDKESKTEKIRDMNIANCFQEVYDYIQNV